MSAKKQIENVGFVKTVLMLMIILGHSFDFWTRTWFTENPALESRGIGIIATWINSFNIFAFALVSGYLFAFKVVGGGYRDYSKFLENKAKRLLVPYVFSMLIWVAPISAYFFQWGGAELFKKYVLCINPSQLWFLWMLFGVFAIVWPLRNVMIEKPIIGWGIAIVFYGIGIVGGHIIPNVFCIWTACQYVVFFFIGMRIRVKEENPVKSDDEKPLTKRIPWYGWLILDLFLFVGSLWIDGKSGFLVKVTLLGVNFLLHMVGAVMAWSILQMLAGHIRWLESKMLEKLSAYSMPMYLFHQQIIYFTITALNGVVNPWVNAGVNFAVAAVGSFVISAILMRWKVTRFLVGEK